MSERTTQRWVTASEARVESSSRRNGTSVLAQFDAQQFERLHVGQHAIVGLGGRLFTARVSTLVGTDSALLALTSQPERLRPGAPARVTIAADAIDIEWNPSARSRSSKMMFEAIAPSTAPSVQAGSNAFFRVAQTLAALLLPFSD